jgi:FHA domain/von Willebrand factor type A domain
MSSWLRVSLIITFLAVTTSGMSQVISVEQVKTPIFVNLIIEKGDVVLRWHYPRALDTPLQEVIGSINARPLGTPRLEPYPLENAATSIILLLDLGDPNRIAQIQESKLVLLEIADHAKRHHDLAIGVYSRAPEFFLTTHNNVFRVVETLMRAAPRDPESNLGLALQSCINLLSRAKGERRAIYVFTDGHSDDATIAHKLVEQAMIHRVSINFVVSQSLRTIDIATLEAIARGTGGNFVTEDDLSEFLLNPFGNIDSGGRVLFPLEGARKFLWEPATVVKVTFSFGKEQVEFSAAVVVPGASVAETVEHIVSGYPATVTLGFAMVGGLALFFVSRKGGLFAPTKRRGGGYGPGAIGGRSLARLVDLHGDMQFSVCTLPAKIGRSNGNDVVINHKTVSRRHAVLNRDANGVFSIENLSRSNPIAVNGTRQAKCALIDGDIITFGSRQLCFRTG